MYNQKVRMGKRTKMRRRYMPPRINQVLRGTQYLVMTMKGFDFAERWNHAEYVPTNIDKTYLLLLKLIWMNNIIDIDYVRRLGYGNEVIDRALSEGYINIDEKSIQVSENIRNRIENIMGKTPGEIYA